MIDRMDNKLESVAYFTDVTCKNFDGPYNEQFKDGKTRTSGYYKDNKRISIWRTWNEEGKLIDSAYYKNGFIYGLGLSWNNDGKIIDSMTFEEGGNGVSHGYWGNGNRSQKGAYIAGKKNGIWIYYYMSGKKCQEVRYDADSAMAYTCYDENGNIQQKNCIYEQEASFPGGEEEWKRFLDKRIRGYENDPGQKSGTLWVQFFIDSDGSVTNVKVIQHLDAFIDKIAVDAFRKSPKWNPAIQFNRPARAYRKQHLMFHFGN